MGEQSTSKHEMIWPPQMKIPHFKQSIHHEIKFLSHVSRGFFGMWRKRTASADCWACGSWNDTRKFIVRREKRNVELWFLVLEEFKIFLIKFVSRAFLLSCRLAFLQTTTNATTSDFVSQSAQFVCKIKSVTDREWIVFESFIAYMSACIM